MLENLTKKQTIATNLVIAKSFWLRLKGLSFSKYLDGECAWLFPNCQMIHMFFMKYPIGLIFVDTQQKVVEVVTHISPWKVSPYVKDAAVTIEVTTATAALVQIGDQLDW